LIFLLLPIRMLFAQGYIIQAQFLGMEDGLSHYDINQIFQDSRGLIWILSKFGLNRYDGNSFQVYTSKSHGLPHDNYQFICEDDRHHLWLFKGFALKSGSYSIMDPLTEKVYSLEEYTQAPCPFVPRLTRMFNFHQGVNIFVEQSDNVLNYYELKDKRIEFLFSRNMGQAMPLNRYVLTKGTFKLSEDTYLNITSRNELEFLNKKGEFIRFASPDEEMNEILKISRPDNIIPLANEESLIARDGNTYVIYQDTLKIYNLSKKLLSKRALEIKYFGTGKKAIASIRKTFIDNKGNIWFESSNRKICMLSLKKRAFQVELHGDEALTKIRGITTNLEGTIFFVGVYAGRLGNILFQKMPDYLKQTSVRSYMYGLLGIDSDQLWIGAGFNLIHYDTQNQSFDYYEGQERIRVPYQAPNGDMWAGSNSGLLKLDTISQRLGPFKDYSAFPLLQKSSVKFFHRNEKGTWLATSTGLYLVDLNSEKILEYYSDTQKGAFHIPCHDIVHLQEDKAGIFWLATKGSGLIKWDPNTQSSERFTKENAGLSHNILYAVYEDEHENLWIPSNWGLMSFNKRTKMVTTYLEEDGISDNEFNIFSHHQDKEGKLYFGGQNGLTHFHPKDITEAQSEYSFIISVCTKEGHESDEITNLIGPFHKNNSLVFSPNDRSIRLDLAYLDYANKKTIQYSYKIGGYHQDWKYQKDPVVRIFGLPYGEYDLQLRAKSSGNASWQDYPKPITIQVLKPFYLQWWFIVANVLVLVLAMIYLIRRRTQNLLAKQKKLEELVAQRTEKVEQQNEELKALDKVKSRFFANISHELRTPLTLILGPLSYILDKPGAWEKEQVQQQLLVMQRNGKSLLQLIEEILDLSKLEANKLELAETATPVTQFFERIFSVFEPQFQSQGLDYQLDFDLKDMDLHVLIDRKKMEKVLNNYLSNAIKFTPKGNQVSLHVTETDNLIKIKISDTGKGVHPDDLPHIFDRFFQSKQADQKLYGGTGIGLALVNEFAQLMGGKAYAESTLGVGSQFYFELPKKAIASHLIVSKSLQALEQVEDDEALIANIGSDFTILVVEDNVDMRNFVCSLLEPRYKKVLRAPNGAEGLDLLREHGTDIQLVVSDVMMPEVDGLTMLKEIKSHDAWKGIPVIMLTALAAERDKLTALTIGVDDYLTKPFSVTELLTRVQNLLYNYHQRLSLKDKPTDQVEELAPLLLDGIESIWVKELEEIVINSLLTTPLNIEALAIHSHLSVRQFSRKLKLATGLSPSRFIKEVQLQKARTELENGDALSIKEVAYNNGFELPSTFSKIFKARFGKAPSDYLVRVG